MNDEEKINDLERKIKRERQLIEAATKMRQQTDNPLVQSKVDTQMREGRRNLEFFESKLRDLKMRKLGHNFDNMSLGGSTLASRRSADMRSEADGPPTPPPKDSSGYGGYGDSMPSQAPFPGGPPNSGVPKARPNFTKLGKVSSSNARECFGKTTCAD
jgi:hypothetical protein